MAPTASDTGRMVVLAGAGISAIPPSDVPSWWHFNEAVLARILGLAREGFPFEPSRTRRWPRSPWKPWGSPCSAISSRRWAQTGVSRQRAGRWDEAHRQFTVGGAAFALAGDRDEAIRALLYSTDALFRLDKTTEASSLLEHLGQDAGPALSGDVLTRRLRSLQAVASGTLDPHDALDQAAPTMRRVERLGDSAAVGAASLWLANLHHRADDRDAAVEMARRAERLVTDETQKAVAREAVTQFSAE